MVTSGIDRLSLGGTCVGAAVVDLSFLCASDDHVGSWLVREGPPAAADPPKTR